MVSLSCEAEHPQAQEAIHAALAKSDSLYSHWPKKWGSNHCLRQEQSHPGWICLTWKANPNYTVSLAIWKIPACKYSYMSQILKYQKTKTVRIFLIYLVILIHRSAVQGRCLTTTELSVICLGCACMDRRDCAKRSYTKNVCAYGTISHHWQNNTVPTCALWFKGETPYYGGETYWWGKCQGTITVKLFDALHEL